MDVFIDINVSDLDSNPFIIIITQIHFGPFHDAHVHTYTYVYIYITLHTPNTRILL